MSVAKRYEKCFMDAAEIMIETAKDLYELKGDYKVKAKDGKFIDTISWKDVNMDADKYMMQIFPTSALSSTPAARLADFQDLLAAGFIDKEDALKLLDFPDLEAAMNLLNADSNNLERLIETMMDEGKYFPPEPYQNLENAVRKVQQAYLLYRMQGAPEDRLELLRQFMEDCQNLIEKAAQPEGPPMPMSGGPGPEAGAPAPEAPTPQAPAGPPAMGEEVVEEKTEIEGGQGPL